MAKAPIAAPKAESAFKGSVPFGLVSCNVGPGLHFVFQDLPNILPHSLCEPKVRKAAYNYSDIS